MGLILACLTAVIALVVIFGLVATAQPRRFVLGPIEAGRVVFDALPFWFEARVLEGPYEGVSSGGCARTAQDLLTALNSIAMAVPVDAEAFAVTFRMSWAPKRPVWLGAAPDLPSLQRCPWPSGG